MNLSTIVILYFLVLTYTLCMTKSIPIIGIPTSSLELKRTQIQVVNNIVDNNL